MNVKFRGQPPEGAGTQNRHGMPQLPVGQHEVKNWPVLDLGEQPEVDRGTWQLEIGGLGPKPGDARLGRVPGAAAGRRRQRLSLRDDVVALRQPLARRAVQDARRAGRADRRGPVRPLHRLRLRAGHVHPLHHEPAARSGDRGRRPAGPHLGGPTAAPRARRSRPHDHAQALCVEGHEVDPQDRVPGRRSKGILGGARLLEFRGAVVQRSVFNRRTRGCGGARVASCLLDWHKR